MATSPTNQPLPQSEPGPERSGNPEIEFGSGKAPGQQDANNPESGVIQPEASDPVEADKPQQTDVNVVDWDGPDDAINPMNWSSSKRWGNIAVLAIMSLNVPLASTMFAPGVPELLDEFNETNPSLATFVVSVFILGLAAGPLVLAPLSEMYGRAMIYHVGNILFIFFTLGCALSTSMGMLIAFRFLAGLVGSGPITIGGGSIADMTSFKDRMTAMSVWSLGPLVGPSVGPIIGGFVAQAIGWRWIFWILTICAGAVAIVALVFLSESHAPTLLARKAKKLQKETGNMNLRSKLASDLAPRQLFLRSIVRPSKILVLSPTCLILSIYSAFVYALIYFMFSTFSFVFEVQYGFSSGTVGLVYIALGIGMMLGLVLQQTTGDRILKLLVRRSADDKSKPEFRVPNMIIGGLFIPPGLLIYGWTAEYQVQWAVPLLGTLLVGVGICLINVNINLYLVEAFTLYAASAIAASTVLRSIFGAVFPLFALQLFDTLDYGWGNSLLAFLALALWSIPVLFFFYGEKLRTHPKFQVKME